MVYYGLLLFFVLEYLRPMSFVPALNALHLNAVVPLTVLAGSLFTDRVKIPDVLRSSNARWIMFLLSLIAFSGLICDVKHYALDIFLAVLGYFFMFIIVKKEVYDLPRIKGVFAILILVHLAAGLLTPELFSGDGERHYIGVGAFGDGNDFALSVNIVIPFCLFMMLESGTFRTKLLYAGILMVLVLTVVATQSRGGMMALASTMFYFWLKKDQKIFGVVGMVFIVGIILAVAPPKFFERMETMTQTGEEMEGSAQGRILAWKAAGRMAADHPLTGVGAGHFAVKYGMEYRPEGYGRTQIGWQTAHSSYFLLLGELGIPGVVFLIMIISSSFIAGERLLRKKTARLTDLEATCRNLVVTLNASLLAFAVGGAFLSGAYYVHIYLLAALVECGRDISRQSLASDVAVHGSVRDVPLVYRGASA